MQLVNWQPRSLVLTPIGYFCWSCLINKVFETKPSDIGEQKERLIQCSDIISTETLQKIIDNMYGRFGQCEVARYQQFEHLIK